jgi:TrpR-related protein YerC/YecD
VLLNKKLNGENKMDKLHTKDVDALCEAILTLETLDECYKFFEDACTIKEIFDIAQRLKAAKMLKAGKNYLEVCAETGMSSATISRVSKCLEYGEGGYELVLERTSKNKSLQ